MSYNRYQYKNGLDIIAPLKHGTRWLEEETSPISVVSGALAPNKLEECPITENTYWVYRNSKDYLISALKTEIRTAIEFKEDRTEEIVDNFISGTGTHWKPDAYFVMYNFWKEYNIKPIHLNDLSSLFENVVFIKRNYEMVSYKKTKYDNDEFYISKIGVRKMRILNKLSQEDAVWLQKILENK